MVREDQRELLSTPRVQSILMRGWKAITLTRVLVLLLLWVICAVVVTLVEVFAPTAWFWKLLCTACSLAATVLCVYHAVSELLEIRSAAFEIVQDRVYETMPSDSRQKNAALFLGVRAVYLFRFFVCRDPGAEYAEYSLSFEKQGKVGVGKAQYDRAEAGDCFYLILLGKNQKAVKCVLSAKTYRIK